MIHCNKCSIASLNQYTPTWGKGKCNFPIMFIGEAPGYYEAKYKVPFVGKAGQKLTEFIIKYGFNRQDIYMTNVVKCRPINNDVPSPIEITNCTPYLAQEITKEKPRIIVTLGNTALRVFFGSSATIYKYHGKPVGIGNKVIIPMFHPSYIIRTPEAELLFDKDFQMLVNVYRLINPYHYPLY